MILSLEGVQGTGKTTAAVALAYEEHENSGIKIISNDHLNIQDFTHFSLEWFLENLAEGSELEDCILILDEMYQIADSRSSQTKLNKLFTYFIVQTRKRGVHLYICTHHLDHIDLRLRRAVDIRGICRCREAPCKRCRTTGKYNNKPCDRCLGYGKVGTISINMLDRRLRRRYQLELLLTGIGICSILRKGYLCRLEYSKV